MVVFGLLMVIVAPNTLLMEYIEIQLPFGSIVYLVELETGMQSPGQAVYGDLELAVMIGVELALSM